MEVTLKVRHASSVKWNTTSYIPVDGEPTFATDTRVFKIGDGHTPWSELPSYATYEQMLDAVEAAVQDEIIGDIVTHEQLQEHIDSEDPHPNYDDGADLTLLYENAKV